MPSPKAPKRSRARSPPARPSASPAAATRSQRSPNTASRRTSATYPPAAVRSSKCSRARRCRRSKSCSDAPSANGSRKGDHDNAAANDPEQQTPTTVNRATKIVATLGPATSDPGVLEQLLRAGVDVVRLNFSHGAAKDHIDRAQLVRDTAVRVGKPVALMADLQGPKIRVGRFADGKVMLKAGDPFVLDAARSDLGDQQAVGLDY